MILHGVLTKTQPNSATIPRCELDVPIPKLLMTRRLITLNQDPELAWRCPAGY
ncbi:hypothetical protein [Stygiolobus sp. CP859M]|uniref:hypothetical protein n=1 Tax=Stygiolobus sp. CP859M TaxID=3133135 RepID=UPI00307DCFFB